MSGILEIFCAAAIFLFSTILFYGLQLTSDSLLKTLDLRYELLIEPKGIIDNYCTYKRPYKWGEKNLPVFCQTKIEAQHEGAWVDVCLALLPFQQRAPRYFQVELLCQWKIGGLALSLPPMRYVIFR